VRRICFLPVVYANDLFIAESIINGKFAHKIAIDSHAPLQQLFNYQHTDDMLHHFEDSHFGYEDMAEPDGRGRDVGGDNVIPECR
jgi:hypothetical protein